MNPSGISSGNQGSPNQHSPQGTTGNIGLRSYPPPTRSVSSGHTSTGDGAAFPMAYPRFGVRGQDTTATTSPVPPMTICGPDNDLVTNTFYSDPPSDRIWSTARSLTTPVTSTAMLLSTAATSNDSARTGTFLSAVPACHTGSDAVDRLRRPVGIRASTRTLPLSAGQGADAVCCPSSSGAASVITSGIEVCDSRTVWNPSQYDFHPPLHSSPRQQPEGSSYDNGPSAIITRTTHWFYSSSSSSCLLSSPDSLVSSSQSHSKSLVNSLVPPSTLPVSRLSRFCSLGRRLQLSRNRQRGASIAPPAPRRFIRRPQRRQDESTDIVEHTDSSAGTQRERSRLLASQQLLKGTLKPRCNCDARSKYFIGAPSAPRVLRLRNLACRRRLHQSRGAVYCDQAPSKSDTHTRRDPRSLEPALPTEEARRCKPRRRHYRYRNASWRLCTAEDIACLNAALLHEEFRPKFGAAVPERRSAARTSEDTTGTTDFNSLGRSQEPMLFDLPAAELVCGSASYPNKPAREDAGLGPLGESNPVLQPNSELRPPLPTEGVVEELLRRFFPHHPLVGHRSYCVSFHCNASAAESRGHPVTVQFNQVPGCHRQSRAEGFLRQTASSARRLRGEAFPWRAATCQSLRRSSALHGNVCCIMRPVVDSRPTRHATGQYRWQATAHLATRRRPMCTMADPVEAQQQSAESPPAPNYVERGSTRQQRPTASNNIRSLHDGAATQAQPNADESNASTIVNPPWLETASATQDCIAGDPTLEGHECGSPGYSNNRYAGYTRPRNVQHQEQHQTDRKEGNQVRNDTGRHDTAADAYSTRLRLSIWRHERSTSTGAGSSSRRRKRRRGAVIRARPPECRCFSSPVRVTFEFSAGLCVVRQRVAVAVLTRRDSGGESSSDFNPCFRRFRVCQDVKEIQDLNLLLPCGGKLSTDAFLVHRFEVLVLRRKGSSYFEIPKGHLEQGETLEQAAEREVREEAGILNPVKIGFPILSEIYSAEASSSSSSSAVSSSSNTRLIPAGWSPTEQPVEDQALAAPISTKAGTNIKSAPRKAHGRSSTVKTFVSNDHNKSVPKNGGPAQINSGVATKRMRRSSRVSPHPECQPNENRVEKTVHFFYAQMEPFPLNQPLPSRGFWSTDSYIVCTCCRRIIPQRTPCASSSTSLNEMPRTHPVDQSPSSHTILGSSSNSVVSNQSNLDDWQLLEVTMSDSDTSCKCHDAKICGAVFGVSEEHTQEIRWVSQAEAKNLYWKSNTVRIAALYALNNQLRLNSATPASPKLLITSSSSSSSESNYG